jgi:PAS domain-containing protein
MQPNCDLRPPRASDKRMQNDPLIATTLLEKSGASTYWRRVGEVARQALGATSSIVAELLPGTHHLVVRVLDGVDLGRIKERRLDIRRSPYRKPHTTLGPAWHDEYLTEGRTLLVPLLVEESELVGFWMVSFERRSQVGAAHMAQIEALAHELARALATEHEPEHATPFDDEEPRKPEHALAALAEALPFGVFVATLWGEIRYANRALVQTCTQRRIDLAAVEGDMVALLSELTLRRFADIRDELRSLVQAEEVCLRGESDDIVVSCQKGPDDAEQRFVVGRLVPKQASSFARGSLDQTFEVVTLAPIEDEQPPRRITRPLYTLAG